MFSRGDSNLVNWHWHKGRVFCVDFEFAGHSDVAFDIADLVEHISARVVPDDIWSELLTRLGLRPQMRPRFLAARRTCALRWLAVLWKQRTTRAAEFRRQLIRVERLLTAT